ncbi:MAG: hypothetical protein Q7T71_16555 [Herbiconiux sp.]|nr:hypothetical protein [Herbiconiux sp.]
MDNRSLVWREARPGLWIARRNDGSPSGIVTERWNEGFQVTAADGRDLGTFPRVGDARAALERADRLASARTRLRTGTRAA